MAYDPSKIAAASFMPGLQNSGTVSTTASFSGTLNPEGSAGTPAVSSNMVGSFIISLPDPTVIAYMRVTFPNANGDLADKWFPLIGTVILDNFQVGANFRIILMVSNSPQGRQIDYNFANFSSDTITFGNSGNTFPTFTMDIYGHLYTIPW